MFVTYLLYSEKFDQLYIGYTSDLISRFHSHNSLAKKGHTIKFRPWIVVYLEFHDSKSQAMLREKQLKSSKGRQFCKNKIQEWLISVR